MCVCVCVDGLSSALMPNITAINWSKEVYTYMRHATRMKNNEANESRHISALNRYAAKESLHNGRTQIENFGNYNFSNGDKP